MPPITIEDNSNNVRVVLGDISAAGDDSDFGLKVVSSDGSTVIIDGTSTMFKIQATGTLSGDWPPGAGAANTYTADVSVAAYTPPAVPAFLFNTTDNVNSSSSDREVGSRVMIKLDAANDGVFQALANPRLRPIAGGLTVRVVLVLDVYNTTFGAGITGGTRYYIFLEAAI